ncbi:MAG: hypothetical protein U0169_01780 [Polyangiaceae bacterium]
MHIARWDLDKTYLRTEFDTIRDLLRTAFERPDEKRTNPGAATMLREMVRAGVSVHILSGSPEQMRSRLEDKLRLDGIKWDSFTLKPNLQNILRLRFRALRDQLGYKLPALLRSRALVKPEEFEARRETLFGDDAEADAFVYSLYADLVTGKVDVSTLERICEGGRLYEDVTRNILDFASVLPHANVVERILIHLERQSAPEDFQVYGGRVVPFYNYLQAAFVVHEDGRLPSEAVLRVAVELVIQHRFDGDRLARSYLDVARRGHLRGIKIDDLARALESWGHKELVPGSGELTTMLARLPAHADVARREYREPEAIVPDYDRLVHAHNRRRR